MNCWSQFSTLSQFSHILPKENWQHPQDQSLKYLPGLSTAGSVFSPQEGSSAKCFVKLGTKDPFYENCILQNVIK